MPSIPEPQSVRVYIEDGARIAAILLIWGVIAAFFRYGIGDLGLPFGRLWLQFGELLGLTGILNAVLYLLYRTIDYWNANA
jgi:hypothetical protein